MFPLFYLQRKGRTMTCILQPECNFLHGFFRCHLPIETVDVEVRITSMQGMHIFRRYRTTQLIKCIPWSAKLHPHPTMVKKMTTFLELEGKLGPQPQFRPRQPNTNPNVRKDNKATTTGSKKRPAPTKRLRTKTTSTPNPTQVAMQIQVSPQVKTNEAKIQVLMTQNKHPLLESPTHVSTPWPRTEDLWANLFELRKDWLVPLKDKSTNAVSTASPNPHQERTQRTTDHQYYNDKTKPRKVQTQLSYL